MRRLRAWMARTVPDALLITGTAAVAIGCCMIWLPLGIIVGGVELIALSILCGSGGETQ